MTETSIDPYPHPAFPLGMLPKSIRRRLPKDESRHYPQRYLEDLKPLNSPADLTIERIAKSGVAFILAASLIAASADFLWVGNSRLLNISAGSKHRKQTIWLRRILLLEGLAPCHGLASGLLHHWETIIWNPSSAAPHGMVYALMAEYACHRTHYATFAAIAKPGPITRLLIFGTQILGYFLQGLICLIYMPLCFQISRYVDEAASRVYYDLAKDIDAGVVPDIASAKVPAVASLFYVLPENGTMKQVCNCIKADDVFLAEWEDIATWHHHDVMTRMYA